MNISDDIVRNMQQQNIYTAGNSGSNVRPNAPNGHYRVAQQPSNPGSRMPGAPRHVHMPQMYQPNMAQNIVVPPYSPFSPRQPSYTTPQYPFPPATATMSHPFFSYSAYMPTMPQGPSHQRSNVGINTNVGVGIPQGVLPAGPSGHLGVAGNQQQQQIQMTASPIMTSSVPSGPNSGLGVGNHNAAGTPLVSVVSGNINTQIPHQQTRRKHQFRLAIIDPNTKKNILEDIIAGNNNNNSNIDGDQRQLERNLTPLPLSVQAEGLVSGTQEPTTSGVIGASGPPILTADVGTTIIIENNSSSITRDIVIGQTPVVSAITDAVDVEIHPIHQKLVKSRKLPILESKTESLSKDLCTTAQDVSSQMGEITENYNIHKDSSHSENFDSMQSLNRDTISATPERIVVEEQPKLQTELKSQSITEEFKSKTDFDQGNDDQTANTEEAETVIPMEPKMYSQTEESDIAIISRYAEDDSAAKTDIKAIIKNANETVEQAEVVLENVQVLLETCAISDVDNKATFKNFGVGNETETNVITESGYSKICPNDLADSKKALEAGVTNVTAETSDSKTSTDKIYYSRDQLHSLRYVKGSQQQPTIMNKSILPQMNLMPSFARVGNKRVHSMGNAAGGNRYNSSDNAGGRQASMSGMHARNSAKGGLIHINLSLNQDVKLSETDNAWRPSVLQRGSEEEDAEMICKKEKEQIKRKVRGILNKLTPEKFNTLLHEIIQLQIDTPEKMEEVVILVFEKAIEEPNYSSSYAQLCKALVNEAKNRDEQTQKNTKEILAHFQKTLLDKTQYEFDQNVTQKEAKVKKLQPIVDRIKACTDASERAELQALLEDEERKIRRRSGGTVRFVGELFMISILTPKIICACIETLLNPQSEDMLECLCKLLTTVGAKYESTDLHSKKTYSLEKEISKMQAMTTKTNSDGAKISSRVRFMLLDVIDLRKNNWISKRNEAPKTMGQIEKEAKDAQMTAQYLNYGGSSSQSNAAQMATRRRTDDSRTSSNAHYSTSNSMQRGESGTSARRQQAASGNSAQSNTNGNNNNDDVWHVQIAKGNRTHAFDTNKLEGLKQLKNVDEKKMGQVNQFVWSNNAPKQQKPTTTGSNKQNAFAELSSLSESNVGDREIERTKNNRKGATFNKNSNERDRYGDKVNSRTSSRENSVSARGPQQGRNLITSSIQKSSSHTKYAAAQPTSTRSVMSRNSATTSSSYRGEATLNSSPTNAPPSAIFIESNLSDIELMKTVISDFIDNSSELSNEMCIDFIRRIPQEKLSAFLYYLLSDYLHLGRVSKMNRRYLGQKIVLLVQQNQMSAQHFRLAYAQLVPKVNDMIMDIPEIWSYIFEFVGPMIAAELLTISDIWTKAMIDSFEVDMQKKFLKAYLTYCTTDIGPNFTRTMWRKFSLKWTDFMPNEGVAEFVKENKLEYVENEKLSPEITYKCTNDEHVQNVIDHIEELLREECNADYIIDFCNGNIAKTDKSFIRSLTNVLCKFAIVYKDKSYSLDTEFFKKVCIPLFQRFIDAKEEFELECLYAVQYNVHVVEHPRDLLYDIFLQLYDGDIIPKDSFTKWRDSKDQSAGKGVAVKGLNHFFTQVLSEETEETSDENN